MSATGSPAASATSSDRGSVALLELSGVTKAWPAQPPVLRDVTLVLEPGTLTRIGGRNGAGKTTLLRVAAALIAPDAGEVRLEGLHPRRDRQEYQRRLGFLAAGGTGLYARLSARRHLAWWARMRLLPRTELALAVERGLDRFALREVADRRVDRLSMGQRQRVRLAMTFLAEPRVVLLDEPATSLDDEGDALVAGAVEEVTERGGAALVCAPGEGDESSSFDRLFVLREGDLVPAR